MQMRRHDSRSVNSLFPSELEDESQLHFAVSTPRKDSSRAQITPEVSKESFRSVSTPPSKTNANLFGQVKVQTTSPLAESNRSHNHEDLMLLGDPESRGNIFLTPTLESPLGNGLTPPTLRRQHYCDYDDDSFFPSPTGCQRLPFSLESEAVSAVNANSIPIRFSPSNPFLPSRA